jgi:hypothetical protein
MYFLGIILRMVEERLKRFCISVNLIPVEKFHSLQLLHLCSSLSYLNISLAHTYIYIIRIKNLVSNRQTPTLLSSFVKSSNMRFSTAFLAAVASTVISASPISTRQDPVITIQTSIQNWLNDINAVNTFLNNVAAGQSADPATDAANLLPIVKDEPMQLGILSSLIGGTDLNGQANFNTLSTNFPTVPAAVINIMNSGNNFDIIHANIAVINSIRFVFTHSLHFSSGDRTLELS